MLLSHYSQLARCLERRLPGSGLERGPGCHPERSEGSLRPSSQPLRGVYPERSEGVTGILSKYLLTLSCVCSPEVKRVEVTCHLMHADFSCVSFYTLEVRKWGGP